MPHIIKQTVQGGGTADIVVEIIDDSGTLSTVDGTPTVTINDSTGTTDVSSADMTKEVVGRWVYFYSVPDTPRGTYEAIVSVDVDTTSSTRPEKQRVTFEVE